MHVKNTRSNKNFGMTQYFKRFSTMFFYDGFLFNLFIRIREKIELKMLTFCHLFPWAAPILKGIDLTPLEAILI